MSHSEILREQQRQADAVLHQHLRAEQAAGQLAVMRATLAAQLAGPLLASLAGQAFAAAQEEADRVGEKAELGKVAIPVEGVANVALATADVILAKVSLLPGRK